MTSWKYTFKDCELQFDECLSAKWAAAGPMDEDYILAEVDAEVHRLHLLIQKSQADIYKLRKWQKIIKKNEEEDETSNSPED